MDKTFENIDCNLCGSNDFESICKTGQFGLPAHVVICKSCGLSYLNPRWTKARYIQFYTKEYDKYYRPNLSKKLQENDINPIFERLSKNDFLNETPKHILDIGSGAGKNLIYFQSKFQDSQYYAIEPSDAAVQILKDHQVEIVSRDVDANWAEKHAGKFDLIIMRHVLEHFSDPVAALQKIAGTLSEKGLLYIAVPNNFNPTTPLLTNWFRVVHTYYFNKITLEGILNKSGLKPLQFIEGDHFNKGELFTYVVKNQQKTKVDIHESTFQKQNDIFQKRLTEEQKLGPVLKRQMKLLKQKARFILNRK